MAKENKKVAEASAEVKNSDNIREELDSASLGRKELADAALEKIKKERDENTQKEMMQRFQKANYKVDSVKENMVYQRDLAKISQIELTNTDRLARFLMGFTFKTDDPTGKFKHAASTPDIFEKEEIDLKAKTITVVLPSGEKKTFKDGEAVPPIIDYVDYDTLFNKISTNTKNLREAANKKHVEYVKKLDAKYGEYWNNSWRYC